MALPFTYHLRNLLVRKTTTALTVLVIAAVVGVLVWMLGFASALRHSLSQAADAVKLIVLKRGATSESNSAIPPDESNKLAQLADVERDPQSGEPLISPEMLVQVSLPRVRDRGTTFANVAVRGVTERAFQVHRSIQVNGSLFSTGTPEVIVGATAAKQFGGLAVGQTITLGYGSDRAYRVVGTFTADGGPMESEVWGYLPSLMNAYNRSMYSSVSIRLRSGADTGKALEQIAGPAIQMSGHTERDYWYEQSKNIRLYLGISYSLVAVMCLAAVFSIANTMFAAVAGRTREIAMLRTIGFRPGQILAGFVFEAVLLALPGAALGCLACLIWLATVGNTKDMFGATTFTTLAFEITLTPLIAVTALLAVSLVGAVGAFVPAMRAARVEVVTALREP